MLTGINHLTLTVSDIDASLRFYQRLGFTAHVRWDSGAYLSVGDLWLCLSLGNPRPARDYTHIAFDTDADGFVALQQMAKQNNLVEWKSNRSEGQSLYVADPDGHQLEIHVGDLRSRLRSLKAQPYPGLVWLIYDN